MIIQRTFRRTKNGAFWENRHKSFGEWRICCSGLSRLFNIPARATRLWLALHTTDEPDREPLRVREIDERPKCFWRNNRDGYGRLALDASLWPYVGKTVYLQVEYE